MRILNVPVTRENGLIYKIISIAEAADTPQTYVRMFL